MRLYRNILFFWTDYPILVILFRLFISVDKSSRANVKRKAASQWQAETGYMGIGFEFHISMSYVNLILDIFI